ncbi:hypothetical protein O3P69_010845 [Scylla paramamosain]|uniref:Uncharacterized protein n=1 Tax=Scylla paramamosain TaxID=85552 RepID=A0AAW0TGV7_SCYPA
MNWVGGVRRRVLQRDEVRRRQDLFFAAHALLAQKSASGNTTQVPAERSQVSGSTYLTARLPSGSLASRTRISPRKWRSDDLVCERLKRGQGWNNFSNFLQKKKQSGLQANHAADLQPRRKGHSKAAKKVSNTSFPPVRPASIHGPFSRYLLKLELQSVGLKLDEGEEKLGSCEKQGLQSRTKEQRKERDSRNGRLARESTALYKIESGLSFARKRKDKTPYLDRSFGTPWLGGPIFDTSGSSFSSSRTPTDPTLESWKAMFTRNCVTTTLSYVLGYTTTARMHTKAQTMASWTGKPALLETLVQQ